MIHPTAIVHSGAKLARSIGGPYSIIGEQVEIGRDLDRAARADRGRTRIGLKTEFSDSARSADRPRTRNTAAKQLPSRSATATPSANIALSAAAPCRTGRHAHRQRQLDHGLRACRARLQVGNHAVFANVATLAGHVQVGDYAVLGGFTGAISSSRSRALYHRGRDGPAAGLPPYVMARQYGEAVRNQQRRLKRRGFAAAKITTIKRAYKTSTGPVSRSRKRGARLRARPRSRLSCRCSSIFSSARSGASFASRGGRQTRRRRHGRGEASGTFSGLISSPRCASAFPD